MKVSYYYNYDFISPDSMYAEIKEELKSYFQTGVIDDILFSKYTEDCLRRLGRSSFKIEENIFMIEDYQVKLPSEFEAAREVWAVTSFDQSYKMPTACYEQSIVRVTPDRNRCIPGDLCAPDNIKITYKTTGTLIQTFNCHYLLKPSNINAQNKLAPHSMNFQSSADDTFDIRGNKLVTNFPSGYIYMVYYVKDYDENQYQLIPDNIRIIDYLKAYLKYKCFETIYNNVSDETLNQIQTKMSYYENKMYEAKVMAEVEIKKQTIEQQIRGAKAARNRFNKFLIS